MQDEHPAEEESHRGGDWRHDPNFWFRPGDLPERPKRMPHGIYGNGRLARRRDLAGLLVPRETGPILAAKLDEHPRGLYFLESTVLAEACDDGSQLAPLFDSSLCLPQSLREKHVLAIGGTGAGKTSRLILPQLFNDICDLDRTVIALDAKGGVLFEYMVALAARHRPGRRVQQINMMRPNRNTIVWNPISSIECRADAIEMAHVICSAVDAGREAKDPFWLNSSIALLSDVLLALSLDPDPKLERSIAAARAVVDAYPMGMAEFADQHPAGDPYPTEGFPAIYRALEGSNNVTQQSVVADLAQRLVMFGNEQIRRCTGGPNELDLRELVASAGMLVLEVCEADRDQLRPLANLFVSRVFTALIRLATEQPDGRLPCPANLILDELGSAIGALPNFETRLSTLRSRGVSISGAVQTLSQLSNIYGSAAAEAITANFNTKLFFGGGLGIKDAAFASSLSGTMTATATTTTDLARDGLLISSESHAPVGRPVLLPEEIARPAVHPLLGPPTTIFPPDAPPFYVYLAPAHHLSQTAWALWPSHGESARRAIANTGTIADAISVEHIEFEIVQLKQQLGWRRTGELARSWWKAQERKYRQMPAEFLSRLRRLHECLTLYERLEGPGGSLLEEFVDAVDHSGTTDFGANIAFLIWRLTVRWEQKNADRSP